MTHSTIERPQVPTPDLQVLPSSQSTGPEKLSPEEMRLLRGIFESKKENLVSFLNEMDMEKLTDVTDDRVKLDLDKPKVDIDKLVNKVIVFLAGGASLGAAIAQLPGAVIGFGLAGLYSLYYFKDAKSLPGHN